jgi:ABC-type phosphate transport system substrate-binding protein
MRRAMMLGMAMGLLAGQAWAAAPVCALDATVARTPSLSGDPSGRAAMDALLALYRAASPGDAAPARWDFPGAPTAIGALMFELTDMVVIGRPFTAAEIAPYEHQYHGDMIKAPFAVRIGLRGNQPLWIAANRRPDSPLPGRIARFVDLALSDAGQKALAMAGVTPLDPTDLRSERARVAGFTAPLDPALPAYRPVARLGGAIRSIGSDGMKDLMDGWECRFHALQPEVGKGEYWEHLGTLNGFNALLTGQADIAPMGRELWPQELEDWRAVFGGGAPIEIMVARGGFDTPQRTTAQAIFVHPSNPIAQISMAQLAGIFGRHPTITRWGQLGLTGSWANRPIHIRIPPRIAPNAMSMQIMVLHGKDWNDNAIEAPIAQTAAALLDDPEAIGFGGLEEGAPGLRNIAVANGGTAVAMTAETVSSGRYPLTRGMYIRLAHGPVSPRIKAFLRFILSRDGQERVRYSGYFPLSAAEARTELAKLDQASSM